MLAIIDKQELYECLKKHITIGKIYIDEPMKNHTTFKIGGNADFLIRIKEIEELKSVIKIAKKYKQNITILGNGSNVLVKDNGIRGIVIIIDIDKIEIQKEEKNAYVTVDAGAKLSIVASKLLTEEIQGFEFAYGIPGTIGGAIRMNAGAHGKEMKDIVEKTICMDYEGNIYELNNESQQFTYRNSVFSNKKYIILRTILKLEYGTKQQIQEKMDEYSKYRKEKQPIKYPNAGSTFKRGNDFISSKLIDECGLKGYTIGGAQVSTLHAGFIVNISNAKASDVIELIEYVQKNVYEKYKKILETEIEIIGE